VNYTETSLAPIPRGGRSAPQAVPLNGGLDTRRANSDFTGGIGGGSWFGIGYDAVHHKGRRATPMARVLSEDQELRQLPRRNLTTNLRDLNRNFAIAAWLIRRHLDYVATFHFRSKTGIPDLDRQIERFMTWWGRKENCDCAGRHNLQRLMRMWEMRRAIDGDVLVNRLAAPAASGGAQRIVWHGTIQTIEGDRIQTFGGVPFKELGIEDPRWVVNGVWVDQVTGRDIGYAVFKRMPWWTGLIWDRMVWASHADLHGYFDRIDQVRGISPLAAAANTLRDTYELFDYAVVKAKVAQFFAMVFNREQSDPLGQQEINEQETFPETDAAKQRYDVDMGRGPLSLDLDPGDKAEILESKQPSTETQEFAKLMIMVALKALDIPMSFYDESHTNFSGSQLARVQYVESAKIKQNDNRSLLDRITHWRLALRLTDPDDESYGPRIELPKGMTIDDLRWQWTHAGVPMYDVLKDMAGSVAAINAGLSSTPREAHKLGVDAYELLEEQSEFIAAAKARGVVLSTALPSIAAVDPANSRTQTEVQNVEEQEKDEGKPTGKPARREEGR